MVISHPGAVIKRLNFVTYAQPVFNTRRRALRFSCWNSHRFIRDQRCSQQCRYESVTDSLQTAFRQHVDLSSTAFSRLAGVILLEGMLPVLRFVLC